MEKSRTDSKTVEVSWKKKRTFKDQRDNAFVIIECSNVVPFRWSSGKFHCSYCKTIFKHVNEIRPHAKDHPNRLEIFDKLRSSVDCIKIEVSHLECGICSKSMIGIDSLKKHLIDEHNKCLDSDNGDGVIPFSFADDTFKCVECGEKFLLFFNLNRHMNGHYQRHVCDNCGKAFAALHRLKSHIQSHEVGAYPCPKCGVIFRSRSLRYSHVAQIHGQGSRYACPHCDGKFSTYGLRNRHLTEKHGQISEYPCSICPAVFRLCNSRTKHIKNVHIKKKVHDCSVCDDQFVTSHQLKSHMVRHTGERKYQCTVCKRAYARPNTLKEHTKTHTDDRRHICVVCGQTFIQNCSLKQHMKVHHADHAAQI